MQRLAPATLLCLAVHPRAARTKDGTVWFWGEEFAVRGLLGVRGNQRFPVRVPIAKLIPN